MLAFSNIAIHTLIIGLIIVALVALGCYAICAFIAKRPDWGRAGAALIAVLGCLLVLLDATGN